jgi:hypothetical protein
MIVNVSFTLVFNTGLFTDDCRAWQARTMSQKTWTQFKVDFLTAHREYRLTNWMAQQLGFHSANTMIDNNCGELLQGTADAIAQLAVVMASDHWTVATLTATNAKLTKQLEEAQSYIKKLNQDIIDIKANDKPAWQGQRPAKVVNNEEYCWWHEY